MMRPATDWEVAVESVTKAATITFPARAIVLTIAHDTLGDARFNTILGAALEEMLAAGDDAFPEFVASNGTRIRCSWPELALPDEQRAKAAALYACHNKPREVPKYLAQDGYFPACTDISGISRAARYIEITHVMSTDCRYDRAQTDSRCAGCNSIQEKAGA